MFDGGKESFVSARERDLRGGGERNRRSAAEVRAHQLGGTRRTFLRMGKSPMKRRSAGYSVMHEPGVASGLSRTYR